jgi:hypothetical protein
MLGGGLLGGGGARVEGGGASGLGRGLGNPKRVQLSSRPTYW